MVLYVNLPTTASQRVNLYSLFQMVKIISCKSITEKNVKIHV